MSEAEIPFEVSTPKARRGEIAWIAALIALPFVYLAVVLLPEPFGLGKHYGNDFYGNRIWWTQFNAYYLSHGILPLWNPLERFGVMQLGYRGANLGYPPGWWLNAAFLKGGMWNYFAEYLQIALHMSWGLGGIYALLRRFGRVHPPAAVLGASLVLLNQRFNESVQYANTIESFSWMPWVLLCTLAITTRSKCDLADGRREAMAWTLGLGLSLGMALSAGYPHLPYSGVLFTAVVGLLTLRSFKCLAYLAGAGLLAVLIALPTIIGLLADLANAPERTGNDITWAASFPLAYSYITMFAQPYSIDVQASAYFIPVFLLLAGVGGVAVLIPRGQRRLSLALLIGVILMADISRGLQGYTFTFLYEYLPGFSGFRIQGRHNWMTLVGLTWFVSHGVEWLQQDRRRAEWFILPMALMCAYLVRGFLAEPFTGSSYTPYAMENIPMDASLIPFVWLCLGGGLVAVLFLRFRGLFPQLLSLLALVIIFVMAYAQYATWLGPNPSPHGMRGPADSFPDGVLERMTPFQGDPSRMLHPKGEMLAEHPANQAYAKHVPEDARFPATRFASNGEATLKLDRFGPNELQLTVNQEKAAPVLYFGTFFPFWKSNVPMRSGKGAFSHFIVLEAGAGETKIELLFRPMILVLSTGLSLLLVPIALAGILFLHRKRSFAVCVLVWAIVPVAVFLRAAYMEVGLPNHALYGAEEQALDPSGEVLTIEEVF